MTQNFRRDTGEVVGGTRRSNFVAGDRALRGLARPDGRPEVLTCVTDQDDGFLEGRVGNATFAASLQLDGDGAVARSLCFRCPLVLAPRHAWTARRPGCCYARLRAPCHGEPA